MTEKQPGISVTANVEADALLRAVNSSDSLLGSQGNEVSTNLGAWLTDLKKINEAGKESAGVGGGAGLPPATTKRNESSPFPGVTLPAGCSFFSVSEVSSVAVCQPPRDSLLDKLIVTLPSLVISLIAIAVSVAVFSYNKKINKISRALSIQDEFWIRKIISPTAIEPLLKYTTGLASALPAVGGAVTADEAKDLWAKQVNELRDLMPSFEIFRLIGDDFYSKATDDITVIEDCVANYYGSFLQYMDGSMAQAPDRADTARVINQTTINMLLRIQQHQSSLNDTMPKGMGFWAGLRGLVSFPEKWCVWRRK